MGGGGSETGGGGKLVKLPAGGGGAEYAFPEVADAGLIIVTSELPVPPLGVKPCAVLAGPAGLMIVIPEYVVVPGTAYGAAALSLGTSLALLEEAADAAGSGGFTRFPSSSAMKLM
jgi:hypothetical protein